MKFQLKDFQATFRNSQNPLRRNPRAQIATLTAYRKSLIHECVTGQRRITEAEVRAIQERAAKLTQEPTLPHTPA